MPEQEKLMSIPDAAEKIGVSPATLNRAARLGTLKARKIGRNWLTTLADAEAWKNSAEFHKTGPKTRPPNA